MYTKIAAAALLSLALAPQQRGWVSGVTASGDNSAVGTIQFTITGNNPCGAVSLDPGDGSGAVTHAIARLPVTLSHEFRRAGEFRVRARGMGNCDGDIFSNVSVPRGSSGGFPVPGRRDTVFDDLDSNNDGVITRAEWRNRPGSADAFDDYDWNNDGRLSGSEIRQGAIRFGGMDRNRNGMIERSEWRGNARSFDQHDWNNDGRLSGDEVRPGAPRPGVVEMPGGRGRGFGRGRGQEPELLTLVSARNPWTDTGIDVRAGQLLDIDATGTVRFSSRAADTSDPNGAGHLAEARAPLPRLAIGALIGRIGNSAPFFVGANRNGLRAPANGRLFLGVNDDVLSDNSGQFQARIIVGR